jgi:hypothetical protein
MLRQSTRRNEFLERLRYFNKAVTNRLTMTFAGRHLYAVVHHIGRRSRWAHATPVVAMPMEAGFVIPLPYGAEVDWCRNVMAANGCELELKGHMYQLGEPHLIDPPAALPFFPGWLKGLLRQTQMYLWLKRVS